MRATLSFNMLIIFSKKVFVWCQWNILGPKMAHPNFGTAVRFFFSIFHNEKGQQVDESSNNGMYQKTFFQDKWFILGPQMAHPDNSGSALRIFSKFCRMKRTDRHMEILLVFFRGKISFGVI